MIITENGLRNVIFTKQEIKQLLKGSCENISLSHEILYTYMLEIMEWGEDDEPRDITAHDVDSLADFIARDADVALTAIERITSKDCQNKTPA